MLISVNVNVNLNVNLKDSVGKRAAISTDSTPTQPQLLQRVVVAQPGNEVEQKPQQITQQMTPMQIGELLNKKFSKQVCAFKALELDWFGWFAELNRLIGWIMVGQARLKLWKITVFSLISDKIETMTLPILSLMSRWFNL